MAGEVEPFALLLLGIWAASEAYERVEAYREPSDPVEAAKRAYVQDQIDERGLERELELALDPEVDRIRDALEPIGGIGPKTARAVAIEFDSLDEVRRADRERLEDAHGVGPSTAEAIETELEA